MSATVNKNVYKTPNLYKGQRFEYQLISDLYDKLKWDAFKMPVDYGFDVAAIPSPCKECSCPYTTLGNDRVASSLLAQVKSYCFQPNHVYDISPNKENVGNMLTTSVFHIDFEETEYMRMMRKSKNVYSIMVIYLDISNIKQEIYIPKSNDKNLKSVNEVYTVWFSFDQLEILKREGWLETITDADDKTVLRLYLRFQGEYQTDNHSLEFWVHNKDKENAFPVSDIHQYSINESIFQDTAEWIIPPKSSSESYIALFK